MLIEKSECECGGVCPVCKEQAELFVSKTLEHEDFSQMREFYRDMILEGEENSSIIAVHLNLHWRWEKALPPISRDCGEHGWW